MKLRHLTDQQFAYLLIVPLVLFNLALTIYPLLFSLGLSFENFNPIARTSNWVGLGNYVEVILKPETLTSMWITVRFSVFAIVVSTLLSLGIALLLNEEFFGRPLVRALVLLPWAIAEYTAAVIFAFFFDQSFGLLNGALYTLGLIQGYIPWLSIERALYLSALAWSWHWAPLGAFFFLGALQAVPHDLYNSARIDGAGPVRRFRVVTAPFLRHAFMVVLILSIVESLRELDLIFVMTYGGPAGATQVFSYWIYRTTFQAHDMGLGAAMAWILAITTTLVTLVLFVTMTRRTR